MRPLSGFVLELTGYLSLCGIISILLGVPALWTVIGIVILVDFGVIQFLGRSGEPTDPGYPHPHTAWRSMSGAF